MKINTGSFVDGAYIKQVNFSKAVLWKDRQLSIPLSIWEQIKKKEIKTLIYRDPGKNEQWIFSVEKVEPLLEKKRVGQEPQYYFPIELAKKIPLAKMD